MNFFCATVSAIAIIGCGRLGFAPSTSSDAHDRGDATDATDALDQDARNCVGHDEDGDGITDNCDNCPATPNLDQLDIGEIVNGSLPDGVGDACDPRPNLPGDFIAFFNGCDQASADFTYFGTVNFSQDGMVLGNAITTGSAQLAYQPNMTRSVVQLAIVKPRSTAGAQWAGFWYRNSTPGGRAVLASVNQNNSGLGAIAELDETVPGFNNNKSAPITIAPNLLIDMAFTLTIDTPRLTNGGDKLRLQSTMPFLESTTSVTLNPGDIIGAPYLEASMMAARIQYLIIYGSQN